MARSEPTDADLRRLRKIADALDTRFRVPGTGMRFGFDGLLGLIPGVGDTLTAAISGYIVVEAWRLGARKSTIARMAWNVGIDYVIGFVPLVGDILDFGFKANQKNIRLLLADLDLVDTASTSARPL